MTGPAGQIEFDYAQITSNHSVTATTAAAATTVVSLPARVYDGTTVIMVEFYSFGGLTGANSTIVINLWDGSTDLGRLCQVQAVTAGVQVGAHMNGCWRITPSAASHTYIAKAWRDNANGTIYADQAPCFIRTVRVIPA